MIEYETCEINPKHFLKILKCSSKNKTAHRQPVILIIPGNPGVIDFYEQFAKDLNTLTGYDVLGLSHTGHLFDDNIKHWEPCDVLTQVNDKVKFIENYFRETKNDRDNNGEPQEIYLVGHSFGCYVILEILEMLSSEVKGRVRQAYMMFPMMEQMVDTPNGKALDFVNRYMIHLVYLLAYLLTFLPKFVQRWMIKWAFVQRHGGHDVHEDLGEVVLNMSRAFSCVRSCFHLGKHELLHIQALNTYSLNKNFELLTFYYGTSDKWVPIELHYDMKYHIADLYERNGKFDSLSSVKLDEHEPPLAHAFVISKRQTLVVSQKIAGWIAELY